MISYTLDPKSKSQNRTRCFCQETSKPCDLYFFIAFNPFEVNSGAVLSHVIPFSFKSSIEFLAAGVNIELKLRIPGARAMVEIGTANYCS